MKTKEFFRASCCLIPVVFLALLAIFMPFLLAADVLGANVFNFSGVYKAGTPISFAVLFFLMYRQANTTSK